MILAPCPNCSGYLPNWSQWIIGRPNVVKGRQSGRIFVSACCGFSNSKMIYDSEAEASAAWDKRRVTGSANDERLKSMLARLDELDWRNKPRNDSPDVPTA